MVLLRKAADQAGLTAALSGALQKTGTPPLLDRGIVLDLVGTPTTLDKIARAHAGAGRTPGS